MRHQKGVTLLEIILALAVASSIVLLGFRMHQRYQQEADFENLQYNVDQLFSAMGSYYRANCSNPNDSAGNPLSTTATLDPRNNPAPANPMLVTLTNLSSYLVNWRPNNSLVASNGYVMQFNKKTANMQVWACSNLSSSPCTQSSTALPANQAQQIFWNAQVAVLLKDATQAAAYKARLGADCISTLVGTTVTPCSASLNTGGYLVWQRLPSFASPQMTSSLWISMPLVKQFNMQYSHDQMYELNSGYTGTSGPRNYLCGG